MAFRPTTLLWQTAERDPVSDNSAYRQVSEKQTDQHTGAQGCRHYSN
jgi:hypothetical protein